MSQQKLAEQSGLKRNNIAFHEAGIVELKAINFLKLAIFFEASPRELFGKSLTANFMAYQQNQPSVIEYTEPFFSSYFGYAQNQLNKYD